MDKTRLVCPFWDYSNRSIFSPVLAHAGVGVNANCALSFGFGDDDTTSGRHDGAW